SDLVFAAVNGLKPPTVQIAAPPQPRPAPSPRLAIFLAPEIRDGLVTVQDQVDRSVVVLRGDGAFESGAAEVRGSYVAVLSRVADALRETHGVILVRGYTDNIPIRSARYPSNWHLSQARADTVKNILEQRLGQPGRVRAEGRGDADPMAPNDTPAGRALNRRVEITLMLSPVPRESTLEGSQP
ncbi:MAG TPA: type VI secretion system protein TssL, long form, partial [Bordetella sp.]|nr:type VI secretion system protein TssL, long form [Bordetella sp.]